MRLLKYATLAIIFLAALSACSAVSSLTGSSPQPVQAQLATACQTLAAAYNTAAGYRAQHKLTVGEINTLTTLEVPAQAACNKSNPPTDMNTALTSVQTWLQQWALINAGVVGVSTSPAPTPAPAPTK
jgi:hypothetical protein